MQIIYNADGFLDALLVDIFKILVFETVTQGLLQCEMAIGSNRQMPGQIIPNIAVAIFIVTPSQQIPFILQHQIAADINFNPRQQAYALSQGFSHIQHSG